MPAALDTVGAAEETLAEAAGHASSRRSPTWVVAMEGTSEDLATLARGSSVDDDDHPCLRGRSLHSSLVCYARAPRVLRLSTSSRHVKKKRVGKFGVVRRKN